MQEGRTRRIVATACAVAALALGFDASVGWAANPGPTPAADSADAESTLDVTIALAQILTALITAGSVVAIGFQIRRAKRDARDDRTHGFQERYHDREFLSTSSLAISFLKAEDADDCVRKIMASERRAHAEDRCLPRTPDRGEDAPRPCLNDIAQYMAFFEDLATAYNREDITRDVIHASFARNPVMSFMRAWWWICWQREGKLMDEGEELWAQWQRMTVSVMQAGAVSEREPAIPTAVLCLPRDGRRATLDDWARARRLSSALDERTDALAEVSGCLDERYRKIGQPATGRGTHWSIVLVPRSVHTQPDDAWRARTEQAGRLVAWLDLLTERQLIDDAIEAIEALERDPTTAPIAVGAAPQ